jgi:hypothetical protein
MASGQKIKGSEKKFGVKNFSARKGSVKMRLHI